MANKQLAVGDRAPNFKLTSHLNQPWELAAALERGPVVLFFYPKDDTPVCIREACAFRDQHEVFLGKNAQVVGVSADSVESHQGFAGRYELPYTLLSDPDRSLRELFGVKKNLGFFDGRVTFVIDSAGVVRHVYSSALGAEAHVKEALRVLEALAE